MSILLIIYRVIVVILTFIPALMVVFVTANTEAEDNFMYWYWTKLLRIKNDYAENELKKIEPRINNGMWK